MPTNESSQQHRPDYAAYIDHTVLKAETVKKTLEQFCDEARRYGFASVCVNPTNVSFVAQQLRGSGVKTCCVVGFPLGASTSRVKAFETKDALEHGAEEVDMVMNIGALKDGDLDLVRDDIKAVVDAAHPRALVKVIIETCLLSNEEKLLACRLAQEAGADFVKTSTGFGSGGATVEDVRLMKAAVGASMQVKASTGINNRAIFEEMVLAGATRMGTSKGIRIVEGDSEAAAAPGTPSAY